MALSGLITFLQMCKPDTLQHVRNTNGGRAALHQWLAFVRTCDKRILRICVSTCVERTFVYV